MARRSFVTVIRRNFYYRLICLGVLRTFFGLLGLAMGLMSWKIDSYFGDWHYNSVIGLIHVVTALSGFLCTWLRSLSSIGLQLVLSLFCCCVLYPLAVGIGAVELWCDAGSKRCRCWDNACPDRPGLFAIEVFAMIISTFLFLLNIMAAVSSRRAWHTVKKECKRKKCIPIKSHSAAASEKNRVIHDLPLNPSQKIPSRDSSTDTQLTSFSGFYSTKLRPDTAGSVHSEYEL